jgi:hypothetical protein
MQIVSIISASILAGGIMLQSPHAKQQAAIAPAWKSIETKIGTLLYVPAELGIPTNKTKSGKRPTSEAYTPKIWPGTSIQLSAKPFSKDETADDSDAMKLEDSIYRDVNLDGTRITRIGFRTSAGSPSIDMEGKKDDETYFRYRACRTKNRTFMLSISGKSIPDQAVLNKVLDSFKPPKDAGPGPLGKWGPVPQTVLLADGHLSVWSPFVLAASDDVPDFGEDNVHPRAFESEFGYSSFAVYYVDLPPSLIEQYDEEGIDRFITSHYENNDDGEPVRLGKFEGYTLSDVHFRSVTYADDTIDGRVDATVKDGKFYLFAASVPRGMLESTDVKRFFSSVIFK